MTLDDDLKRIMAPLHRIRKEREQDEARERAREEARRADPLGSLIVSVPGTIGQLFARRTAVNMILAGNADAAGALVDLIGLGAIPALVEAGAAPAAIRVAIETALLFHYKELPGFIAAHGGRAVFAAWCRRAAFQAPPGTPEVVDVYRGTMGCSPADAATGLHWSLSFDDAAHYACRFADARLTGVIVLHARLPRQGIACFVSDVAHSELVPADVPASYETITDHERIGDAAVRNAHRMQVLKAAGGWREIEGGRGVGRQAAMAARARMAVAGVAPGTAIVA